MWFRGNFHGHGRDERGPGGPGATPCSGRLGPVEAPWPWFRFECIGKISGRDGQSWCYKG
eukprot:1189070-Prorocentrum_minimum.AAC.3